MAMGNKGGRPAKVVAICKSKNSKAEMAARKKAEDEYRLGREDLEINVPGWLSPGAREEFCRVVREAAQVPFLDNLDLAVLAIYADNYEKYSYAAEKVAEEGYMVEGRMGTTINPWINLQNKCADQIHKCSSRLGLATTDRLRIIVPKAKAEAQENKYLKYLQG